MRLRTTLSVSLALLTVLSEGRAASVRNSAYEAANSVAVVELFTSEGCSSCPPADELLRQINLKRTTAGQLIVGISEHVTYWDSLGWRDPYSSPVFTDRQSVYASRLSPEGPYTPQMVLNGQDQFVGSNSAALAQALRNDARHLHLDLGILSSNRTSAGVDVTFSFKGPASKSFDVIAVLADDVDRSNVLRGENGGRLLQHVAVARSLTRVATAKGDTKQSVHIQLPVEFQLGKGSGHHLILFAQEQHQGAIVGAATIPF